MWSGLKRFLRQNVRLSDAAIYRHLQAGSNSRNHLPRLSAQRRPNRPLPVTTQQEREIDLVRRKIKGRHNHFDLLSIRGWVAAK